MVVAGWSPEELARLARFHQREFRILEGVCCYQDSPSGIWSVVSFSIHRIYDETIPAGRRVLVDRLWPRGVKKTEAELDDWIKDAAPSTELRRWYSHEVSRFEEFSVRYQAELDSPPAADAVDYLLALADSGPVLLLTATRDVSHSGAQVLLNHLMSLRGR